MNIFEDENFKIEFLQNLPLVQEGDVLIIYCDGEIEVTSEDAEPIGVLTTIEYEQCLAIMSYVDAYDLSNIEECRQAIRDLIWTKEIDIDSDPCFL